MASTIWRNRREAHPEQPGARPDADPTKKLEIQRARCVSRTLESTSMPIRLMVPLVDD